jgi:hypothetical protein
MCQPHEWKADMVTKAKLPLEAEARKPRRRSASLTFNPNSSRRVRDLTKRASAQISQLRRLLPLYQRTERILLPAGLKRIPDSTGRLSPQVEAGTLLYTLNHELVQFMDRLTDTIAALNAHVDEAVENGD